VQTREQRAQARLQLIAARIAARRARQMREGILLDRVHEAARFACCGNEVVPAPSRQMSGLTAHGRDIGRNRVDAAEIVQQPAVEAVGYERRLDVFDIEPGRRRGGHPSSIAGFAALPRRSS
jgi:hypothetical protein